MIDRTRALQPHESTTVVLTDVPLEALPDLLEEVEAHIVEIERRLEPARRYLADIRCEIERRMNDQGATTLKIGSHVVRFEKIPARASVNTHLIDGAMIAALRAAIPRDLLDKAIGVREIPATVEYKTNLTYLKKFAECGDAAKALYDRLVDPGVPKRRLLIEREEKRIS